MARTLAELIAATGWLPHTTRAALTGLRKRGYAVGIDRAAEPRRLHTEGSPDKWAFGQIANPYAAMSE